MIKHHVIGFNLLREELDNETKLQTIRAPRKNEIHAGDTATMLWKPRTKHCENMGRAKIVRVVSKPFEYFKEIDALRDGFKADETGTALEHLKEAFKNLHAEAKATSMFDIITFEWIEHTLKPKEKLKSVSLTEAF